MRKLSERPIELESEDMLGTKEVVEKISTTLLHPNMDVQSLAVTGAPGVGKTSTINLLVERFKNEKDWYVVFFNPVFCGNVDVKDLVEELFARLVHVAKKDDEIKVAIKNVMKWLSINAIPSSIKLGSENLGLSAEYKPKDIVENLIEVLAEPDDDLYGYLQKFNSAMNDSNKRVLVVIDEIDSLSSRQALNFLVFSRALEMLGCVQCVVSFNYQQMVHKIIAANEVPDYTQAKVWLDKLFQVIFPIFHRPQSLAKYIGQRIDENKSLNSGDMNFAQSKALSEMVNMACDLLDTPRLINRWLMELKNNDSLLKNVNQKCEFTLFLAVIAKYPIMVDYLSKFVAPMQGFSDGFLFLMKSKYRVEIKSSIDDLYKIVWYLAALGFSDGVVGTARAFEEDSLQQEIDEFVKRNNIQICTDPEAGIILREYFDSVPGHVLFLYLQGIHNEDEIKLFNDFFERDCNQVLEKILDQDLDELAGDIAHALKQGMTPKQSLEVEIVERLAFRGTSGSRYNFSSYQKLFDMCLFQIDVKKAVETAEQIYTVETYIQAILSAFDIKNQDGRYNLEKFIKTPKGLLQHGGMLNISYDSKEIVYFEKQDLGNILTKYLFKFKNMDSSGLFSQNETIGPIYRYLEWGASVDKAEEVEDDLKNKLLDFCKTQPKHRFWEILKKEVKKTPDSILAEIAKSVTCCQ